MSNFQIDATVPNQPMNDTSATTVNVYGASRGWASRLLTIAIGIVFGASLFVDLGSEPHFVDESAYVSQAYFGDSFFTGDHDTSLWLEYPAFDLPPLTKYLVWAGLVAGGDPRPGPAAMRAWYADTSKRFETPDSLRHARTPVAVCGVAAIVATGLIALRWRGLFAAVAAMALLTVHPLFRTHARRAMADIPTEMAVAVSLLLFLGVVFGRSGRIGWSAVVGTGIFAGLAASSKLNGLLAGMVVAAWGLMAVGRTRAISLGSAAAAGVVGASVFVALNPFFYCDPQGIKDANVERFENMTVVERIGFMIRHRVDVSAAGQSLFPNDALTTVPQKAATLLVQGFGRFSPLGPRTDDSRVRFEWKQDWPALVWLPWVVAGVLVAIRDRNRAGHEAGPYLALYWIVALVTVGAFLPLAWNRYFMPIVIPSTLMAAGATDFAARAVLARFRFLRSEADA